MERDNLRFLLHLWRDGGEPWRASLRDVGDGQLQTFSGLDELVGFLGERTANAATPGADLEASGRDVPGGES